LFRVTRDFVAMGRLLPCASQGEAAGSRLLQKMLKYKLLYRWCVTAKVWCCFPLVLVFLAPIWAQAQAWRDVFNPYQFSGGRYRPKSNLQSLVLRAF